MGTRIDRRFDYLRKQAEQDANRVGQEQQDQLMRQAASRGRLGSGSLQKQVNQQQGQLQSMKQNAIDNVESQREQALAAQEENQMNRDFAKSERMGSQDFAALQADLGRKYSTAERMGTQEFAASQADIDRGLRSKELDQAQSNWETQFREQKSQWAKQFKLDSKVSKFNMDMAQRAQALAEKPGIFEQFTSPFGTLQSFGNKGLDKIFGSGGGGTTRQIISASFGGSGGGFF